MGFRWFGSQDDPIPPQYIRQIPGVSHVVGAVFDIPAGEVWPAERVAALKADVEGSGLSLEVVESVNVSDAIKIGLPERDRHIENYIETIRHLSASGIKVICYNFMPVFDWIRTDLRQPLPDGSASMAYDQAIVEGSFDQVVARVQGAADGYILPGWEIERLADIQGLMDAYADVDETRLRANFAYFIEAIIDACEKYDVRMAVHPDDPPRSLFGLPRIVKNVEDMRAIEGFTTSPYHGFTVCAGSLGANPDNDVPAIMREFSAKGRAPFVHLRNLKHTAPGVFHESAHPTAEGSLDMFAIVQALHETGFDGYARPDHGRDIWGERGRPGYGLYDRALGITYLGGLWEALDRTRSSASAPAPTTD